MPYVLPTLVVVHSLHPKPKGILVYALNDWKAEKASLLRFKKATTQKREALQIKVIQHQEKPK